VSAVLNMKARSGHKSVKLGAKNIILAISKSFRMLLQRVKNLLNEFSTRET